jgi:Fe-S cluster biogenesis protein NfuA/nitrite reductase/ring-hydroxylating ferredoxin subunit
MSEQARPGDSAAGVDILQTTSERIEALLTASAAGGVVARERAEELVRVVVDLYGAGLERLLDVLHDAGRLDQRALDALADDKLVSGLLLVHGLHPHDVPTRVVGALDSVRPYLASHGGDVELMEITDAGVVRLRLTGSCDGCASSATTLELAVDGAVRDAAPEVTEIEVVAASPPANGVIPISSLRARTASGSTERAAGWQILPAEDLVEGRADGRLVGGVAVVVCRIGTDLFAFRDRCPSCSGPLAGAPLHRQAGAPVGFAVLRCPGCGHHYDVRRAGTSLDGAEESLQPLPLLIRDGQVQIATPAVVMA